MQADYASSFIMNSPLQIALVLAPARGLLSYVVGGSAFTLVSPPLLATTVVASVIPRVSSSSTANPCGSKAPL